jgi:hypothetical protein
MWTSSLTASHVADQTAHCSDDEDVGDLDINWNPSNSIFFIQPDAESVNDARESAIATVQTDADSLLYSRRLTAWVQVRGTPSRQLS